MRLRGAAFDDAPAVLAVLSFASEAAILLVEQHLQLALALAQTAIVLQRGEVALQGRADEPRDDERLLRYLAPTSLAYLDEATIRRT